MTGADVRIQKVLADAGVASRRASDLLVAQGRVSVNGEPAVAGQRVDPGADRIEVDGRTISQAPIPRVYLAMAKPAGVTSTVRDSHADRTVVELVPADLRGAGRIYPVGRLDRDSEGLLLLTSDGDWAQGVLHPKHELEREYAIGLRDELNERQAAALMAGIELDEGLATLEGLRPQRPQETRQMEHQMGRGPTLAWYRAVLRQGWRRQLRRMFAAVEAPVERLIRVRIGPLRLDGMQAGDVRPLTRRERHQLESAAAPARHVPRPTGPATYASGPVEPARHAPRSAAPPRSRPAARPGSRS